MKRSNQKKQKVGYRLSINRAAVAGDRNWELVGYLFKTTHEAAQYKAQKYPGITKFKIEGVRVNVEPVSYHRERGENNASS